MKSLSEWEEEHKNMFQLNNCIITPEMMEEWGLEKKYGFKPNMNRVSSLTITDMTNAKIELHIGIYNEWLKHEAINMDEPYNLQYLSNLTHEDDRIFSLETELMGYSIIMSLPPDERKNFWMKYHRRLMDKNGEYIIYLFITTGYKFDENGNVWLALTETKRLPKKYQPGKTNYREFSHTLNQTTKMGVPVIEKLSKREVEILQLLNEKFTSKDICKKFGTSIYTVINQRKSILRKLKTHSTPMACEIAHTLKII